MVGKLGEIVHLKRTILFRVILIFLIFGVISIGVAQQVVTTTTTTVVTVPGKTVTTVISQAGTTETKTIILGAYRLVHVEIRPDQECVLIIKGEPQSVISIQGTTVHGTTTVVTVPATNYAMTITQVEGGTTLRTTGMRAATVRTGVTMGPITTTFAIPVILYGEIIEHCERITITVIDVFVLKEPMTLSIAYPGYTFPGTTFTIPEMPVRGPITITETKTYPGTTYTTTIEEEGKTIVTTITIPEILETRTVVMPGETITKTITYTTTLPEVTMPEKTETPKSEAAKTPSATMAQAAEGDLTTLLIVVAVAAIVVVLGVMFLKKLRK